MSKKSESFSFGDDDIEYTYFPSSLLSLNMAIGDARGFQGRGILQLIANAKSGKTSLAFNILGESQRKGILQDVEITSGKRTRVINAVFLDREYAYDPKYAKTCGVDTSKLLVIRIEDAIEMMVQVENLLAQGVQFFIYDSIPATITKDELDKEMDDPAKMAGSANDLTRWLKRIIGKIYDADALFIIINQWRAEMSAFSRRDKKAWGPKSLEYWCKHIIELARTSNKDGVATVEATVIKNKQAAEGFKAEIYLNYGEGFDVARDIVQQAIALGIITVEKKDRYLFDNIPAHGIKQCMEKYDINKLKGLLLDELNKA